MRICVATCDKYHILVPACTFFIRRFWDDRPWYLDILANTPQSRLDELPYNKAYVGPDRGWASNMILYLEQLEDELLLLLLDDYFLSAPPNTALLRSLVDYMRANKDVGYINLRPWSDDILHQSEVLFGSWTLWQRVEDKPIVGEYDKETARYLLSLQPGMWRAGFLQSLLHIEENGWQTEIEGTERAREIEGKMLGVLGPFPLPHVNISRYSIWRENQDGTTSRDWVIGQVGTKHWVYKELDVALSGEGL